MAIRHLALPALTLLIAGCASSDMPSFGDSLLQRSAQQQALADQWSDGAKLLKQGQGNVSDGQDKIDRGQKMLDEGRKQLAQGQSQVTEGTAKQQAAVAGYEHLKANPIPLPGAEPAAVK